MSQLYVRLGMTKGAMIAFTLVVIAAAFGFWRLEDVADKQQRTLDRVRAQQRQNLNALREVCRQGETIAGLTRPIIKLLEFDVSHNAVPELALPIYTEALRVFQGYSVILKERTACREITSP
jgi:hypothetical protein